MACSPSIISAWAALNSSTIWPSSRSSTPSCTCSGAVALASLPSAGEVARGASLAALSSSAAGAWMRSKSLASVSSPPSSSALACAIWWAGATPCSCRAAINGCAVAGADAGIAGAVSAWRCAGALFASRPRAAISLSILGARGVSASTVRAAMSSPSLMSLTVILLSSCFVNVGAAGATGVGAGAVLANGRRVASDASHCLKAAISVSVTVLPPCQPAA